MFQQRDELLAHEVDLARGQLAAERRARLRGGRRRGGDLRCAAAASSVRRPARSCVRFFSSESKRRRRRLLFGRRASGRSACALRRLASWRSAFGFGSGGLGGGGGGACASTGLGGGGGGGGALTRAAGSAAAGGGRRRCRRGGAAGVGGGGSGFGSGIGAGAARPACRAWRWASACSGWAGSRGSRRRSSPARPRSADPRAIGGRNNVGSPTMISTKMPICIAADSGDAAARHRLDAVGARAARRVRAP